MAGLEPEVNLERNGSKPGTDVLGDWIAPIIAFVVVVGIFFALLGAIFAPQ